MDFLAIERYFVNAAEEGGDFFGAGLCNGEPAFNDYDKFVTTPAAYEIAWADGVAEPASQLFQDFVSAEVSVIVVDALKCIEVEQEDAEFAVGCDAGLQLAIELATVGNAG